VVVNGTLTEVKDRLGQIRLAAVREDVAPGGVTQGERNIQRPPLPLAGTMGGPIVTATAACNASDAPGCDVHAYLDNDSCAHALLNGMRLFQLLGQDRRPAPG
jgi:hypothetical protein